MMRTGLDDAYVDRLFTAYTGLVPREADLVCYWFAKAHDQLHTRKGKRGGLVATNSIRGGANRRVLDEIRRDGAIFEAWDDEPWVVEGAAVRVSLICFAPGGDPVTSVIRLDGHPVAEIFSDLTARHDDGGVDLTTAARLPGNTGIAFMGDTKGGAFDIPGDLARGWLRAPTNPNSRLNSDVLRPWANGLDLTRRPRDMWIIDFGWTMTDGDASLYEAPFSYAQERIQAARVARQQRGYARHWWRHERPRPDMWAALSGLPRYIATPTVAKHRLFVWLGPAVCPDHQLIVIARDDDTTFGIVHSRLHELWALRLGTWLGVGNDPRYTPSTTFETFPFPDGLSPNNPADVYAHDARAQRIATAARRLNELG